MKDTIIRFDTAKLAKIKGVKLDIDGVYWEDGVYDSGENVLFYEEFPDVVSAPTQSLLQKWLREIHNIYVESHYFHGYDEDRFYYEIKIKSNENYLGNQDSDDNIYTYEQALELGLQEGLNLIKKKNKNDRFIR